MPEMSGDELVQKIHEIRPDIPVILTTGFSDQIIRDKVASLGINRLATKPIIMKDMARLIHEALIQNSKTPCTDGDSKAPG